MFSLVIVLGGEGIQLLTLVGVSVKIKDKQRNTSLTSRALEEFAENFITWLISRLRLQNNYLCHFDLVVCNAVGDYVADCLKNWDSHKEWGIFQSVALAIIWCSCKALHTTLYPILPTWYCTLQNQFIRFFIITEPSMSSNAFQEYF